MAPAPMHRYRYLITECLLCVLQVPAVPHGWRILDPRSSSNARPEAAGVAIRTVSMRAVLRPYRAHDSRTLRWSYVKAATQSACCDVTVMEMTRACRALLSVA